MATFRILILISKTEITWREFSISSRSLRMKIINLDLVSMPEIGGDFFSVSSRSLRLSVRNSRSRLDVRDWIRETLILVSRMKKWVSLTSDLNIWNTSVLLFHLFRSPFWRTWGNSQKVVFYTPDSFDTSKYQNVVIVSLKVVNFCSWFPFLKGGEIIKKRLHLITH